MVARTSPAQRWATALQRWDIPQQILDLAPESPWAHPPAMFVVGDEEADTASHRSARRLLGSSGTVLDVGCGGGRSSLALSAVATLITGVDEQERMLVNFATACGVVGVAHREVLGRWQDVAANVAPADVVVCHHVVYNVADIESFVRELTAHAGRGVVVELPDRHPGTSLAPLWKQFWDLDRPDEPSADLFVELVQSLGNEPTSEVTVRPPRKPSIGREDYVAFVRRRLCLTADRDAEIDEVLGDHLGAGEQSIVTVTWNTS